MGAAAAPVTSACAKARCAGAAAPLTPWLGTLGLTPLYAAVLVGAAQNVFSKSAKYSLFDPCKEMAYIPLDQETQLKARARTAASWLCPP